MNYGSEFEIISRHSRFCNTDSSCDDCLPFHYLSMVNHSLTHVIILHYFAIKMGYGYCHTREKLLALSPPGTCVRKGNKRYSAYVGFRSERDVSNANGVPHAIS